MAYEVKMENGTKKISVVSSVELALGSRELNLLVALFNEWKAPIEEYSFKQDSADLQCYNVEAKTVDGREWKQRLCYWQGSEGVTFDVQVPWAPHEYLHILTLRETIAKMREPFRLIKVECKYTMVL